HPDQRRAPQGLLPEVHPAGVRQRVHLQGRILRLVLRRLRGVQERKTVRREQRPVPQPPDAAHPAVGAVLLLQAVGLPGPAPRVLRDQPGLHPAGGPEERDRQPDQKRGAKDINISRAGEDWGIRIPFDPEFTIYVWFDALLTYITGIGYGDDEASFHR